MSIWGKILGGAAGFALGGPFGALLGGLAGHAVDRYGPQPALSEGLEGTRAVAFTIGVIVLGAKMAKADGVVTRDEVAAFREVFSVPPQDIRNVGWLFDRAKRDASGFEPYARQVAKLFAQEPKGLEDLLGALFHIAKADGRVHPAEMNYLRAVAAIFGFNEAAFGRIHELHVGPEAGDPYELLGVSRDISTEALKQAWRQLVRENHPDRHIAAGVPAEFVAIATERLARINAAYDRIQRERGAA